MSQRLQTRFEQELDIAPEIATTYGEIQRDLGGDAANAYLREQMVKACAEAYRKLPRPSLAQRVVTWVRAHSPVLTVAIVLVFASTMATIQIQSHRQQAQALSSRAQALRYNRIGVPVGWQVVDGLQGQVKVKDFRLVSGEMNKSKITISVEKKEREPLFLYVSLYDRDLQPVATDIIDMTPLRTGVAVANSPVYASDAAYVYYYVARNRANPR